MEICQNIWIKWPNWILYFWLPEVTDLYWSLDDIWTQTCWGHRGVCVCVCSSTQRTLTIVSKYCENPTKYMGLVTNLIFLNAWSNLPLQICTWPLTPLLLCVIVMTWGMDQGRSKVVKIGVAIILVSNKASGVSGVYHGVVSVGPLKGPGGVHGQNPWWGSRGQCHRKL